MAGNVVRQGGMSYSTQWPRMRHQSVALEPPAPLGAYLPESLLQYWYLSAEYCKKT